MKRTVLRCLAAVGFLLVLGAAGASAQDRVRADIPFDFTVGNTSFNAGVYDVSRMTDSGWTILIRNAESAAIVTTHGVTVKRNMEPSLIFVRYGSRYFLRQVLMDGSGTGQELPKSRLETELAANSSGMGETQIAAQLR